MIRYSHAMTCLMTYYDKKRTEAISIMLQANLKIHIAVDIKKKRILSLEVTSEEVRDGKILKKLVDDASANNKVKRVLADGMYDSNRNFRYLSKNHIKPGAKLSGKCC
jgi:Transposase DDE domain